MLVSGRAQSRRVGHVVGLVVRGRRDVAARSTFSVSFPLSPEMTFSRLLIWVTKMRSCNELSGCSEDRLVFDQGECELIRSSGVISGTNSGDLAKKVTSGTNLEDLVEELISGTNPGDFTEELISGTNHGDSVEKVTSGTNLWDLTEEQISGANPEDFAAELILGTNPGDLAEKVTVGINLGDLAEEPISGTNPGDFAERLISGINPVDLAEEPISDTNLGDLAEKVTSDTNPVDLVEGLFASRSLFEQVGMTSSDSSSSVRVISSPGSGGVSQSDPEASSSGASSGPLSLVDSKALEVMKADHDLDTTVTGGSLVVIRVLYSIPTEYGLHVPQPGHHPVWYYTLHMSDLGHQDPNKEMKARWRGLQNSMKIWNDSSVAEEFERGLLHPQLARELYMLPSEVLLARAAKEIVLMTLFDRVHDAGRLITFIDYRISNLQQELDALKYGGGPEAVVKVEERASELEQELGKTKQERDEVLQRLEASEKELTEVRSNLTEIQRLLKEAWVKARKMDDELLQSVKALESAQSKLPKQAVDRYKESTDFKEGLKRMRRVTYEYGYRVALARFRALYLDSKVEEDPFTIHPKDDLVPMKRQQAFDDSDPPES
ncbi:hypothetical protein B296_00004361 [Ensete ventricosum]|uniref:Uncharacterized protein n=1 Tax=Ensete ventricosum TaxID=4639 RepID=A0A427B3R9_ENSVE|nr:hypothetical protein B296_00004361 [Ensete ventricosum]